MIGPIEHRKNMGRLDWVEKGPGFAIANLWARTEPMGSPEDPRRHIHVEGYRLARGALSEAHYHKDHYELVLVWSGSGTLVRAVENEGWRVSEHDLKKLDTISIPPRTLHQFKGVGEDPLVLITVHALNGIPLLTIQQPFKEAPGPSPFEIRNVATIANTRDDNGKLINWEENKNFRAKRIRVWGREAPKGEGGKVDRIKEQLQFTLYTFVPEQENPGHFHPHSIELMIALDGGAFTTIRRKIDGEGWTPEANQEQATLDAGDLVLVPLAGWHRYINRSAERCKVMALQTPHPIMHTLIAETDGGFSPAERSEHVV
jgi:mannose-6-phosphate isomerase-like protein (cupin superfamily)